MNIGVILMAVSVAAASACAADEGPEGPVTLDFGTGIDDTYSALVDGSQCVVRAGLAGGYWAMYRVRGLNVPDGAELDCGLSVGDELVSERPTIMRRGGDVSYGSLQLPVLAMEPDRIDSLAGQAGEIYCYYGEELFSINVIIDVAYPWREARL